MFQIRSPVRSASVKRNRLFSMLIQSPYQTPRIHISHFLCVLAFPSSHPFILIFHYEIFIQQIMKTSTHRTSSMVEFKNFTSRILSTHFGINNVAHLPNGMDNPQFVESSSSFFVIILSNCLALLWSTFHLYRLKSSARWVLYILVFVSLHCLSSYSIY